MIAEYLKQVATRYKTGISREHSYRGDLQQLLQAMQPGILVTNEPARIACGAPDYILKNGQELGRVRINDTQYFDKVPKIAWDFYIGGYQPAQKWLKDRHGRELSFDDILHYQKIVVALCETDRIMKAIDAVDFMD